VTPIGVRAHDLGPRDADGLGCAAAALGFGLLQLAPSKALDDCPPPPALMAVEWAAGVRVALLRSSVRVAVVGCYVDICGPDEASRELARKRLSHNLLIAPSLGSRVVATETPLSGGDPADCLRALRGALERLLPEAEAAGVSLCIEPVLGHAVPSPSAMLELAADLASPALGVILDPVNIADPDARREPSMAAADAAESLGGIVKAVHVKDFSIVGGRKAVARIGEGLMDWERLVPAIARAAPQAPFIIEDQDAEGRAAGLSLLRSALGGK
jgi:L-ribulose-5-phosphate 3-epimerase